MKNLLSRLADSHQSNSRYRPKSFRKFSGAAGTSAPSSLVLAMGARSPSYAGLAHSLLLGGELLLSKSLSPAAGGSSSGGGELVGLAEPRIARSTDSTAGPILGLSLSLCNECVRKEGVVLVILTEIGEIGTSTNTLKCMGVGR